MRRDQWKASQCEIDQIWHDNLKIAYDDDRDVDQAGRRMVCFPLMKQALADGDMRYWMIRPASRWTLVFLIEQLRPKVAIEIGTRFGGSLQALSKYCEWVYSIDIDPDVPRRFGQAFPNVQYLIGASDDLLPPSQCFSQPLEKSGSWLWGGAMTAPVFTVPRR
jgi:hypothetical protein